jgi:hypothetical protein
MSVITMTHAMANQITRMSWGQRRFDVTSRSTFGAQALESGVPLWSAEFDIKPLLESEAGLWKATFLKLAGMTNQIELWNVRRPVPLGTMRGTMVLDSAAEQGDTSITIATDSGQASRTLLQGDLLQLGTGVTQQVIMLTENSTADVNGDIVITFQSPLRNDFDAGSSVVWDKPKVLFRRTETDTNWNYEPFIARGFAMTLMEDWRP